MAERKKIVVNLQELLGARGYTAAKNKKRTNVSSRLVADGQKRGKNVCVFTDCISHFNLYVGL